MRYIYNNTSFRDAGLNTGHFTIMLIYDDLQLAPYNCESALSPIGRVARTDSHRPGRNELSLFGSVAKSTNSASRQLALVCEGFL